MTALESILTAIGIVAIYFAVVTIILLKAAKRGDNITRKHFKEVNNGTKINR